MGLSTKALQTFDEPSVLDSLTRFLPQILESLRRGAVIPEEAVKLRRPEREEGVRKCLVQGEIFSGRVGRSQALGLQAERKALS